MSKTLTSAQSIAMQKKLGAEPVILVEVDLGGSYGTLRLSDKNLTVSSVAYSGKILNLSNFRTDKRVDNLGVVSSLTVELDDSTEIYRQSLNLIRWCGKTVRVYHHFVGVEPLLLLVGKVSTPVEWTEEKNFVFNVLSVNDGEDVGCVISDNAAYNKEAIGKNIPIVFGTVIDMEVPMILKPVTGKLLDAVTVTTVSTTNVTLAPFKVENGSKFPQGTTITLLIGDERIRGSFAGDVFTPVERLADVFNFVSILESDPEKQLGVIRTTYLPRNIVGRQITMFQPYTGGTAPTFSGIGKYTYRVLGQKTSFMDASLLFPDTRYLDLTLDRSPSTGGFETLTLSKIYGPDPGSTITINNSYKVLQPGTPVLQDGETDTVYAVNCETGVSELLMVKAFKSVEVKEGTKEDFLVQVPSHLYTASTIVGPDGHPFYAISFERPLSVLDEDWSDEIYVSMRSTVGPNISDIIKWIIQNYTTLSVNISSFDAYRNDIDKYPANFALFDSKEAVSLCAEIAYQARTALRINNGIVSILYLSQQPGSTKSIGNSDLIENSIKLYLSDSADIVTQMVGTFRETYNPEAKEQTVKYKNNVDIFGFKEEKIDFYIFNSKELVTKTLNFWGYRKSNQWLKVDFATFLTTLDVEIFDCIGLNIDLLVSTMIVENVDFDSEDNSITFEAWVPRIAGTAVQAPNAWLSDVSDVKPAAPTVTVADVPEFQKVLTITPVGSNDSSGANSFPGIVRWTQDGFATVDIYRNGLDLPITEVSQSAVVLNEEQLEEGQQVIATRSGANLYVSKGGGGLNKLVAGGTDAEIAVAANDDPTEVSNGVKPTDSTALLSTALRVVNLGGLHKIAINLRDIMVFDPATNRYAPLSSVFRIDTNNTLSIKSDVKVSDGTNNVPMGLKYDSINQKWLMEGTFLQVS